MSVRDKLYLLGCGCGIVILVADLAFFALAVLIAVAIVKAMLGIR
jgi:hypothetical protein